MPFFPVKAASSCGTTAKQLSCKQVSVLPRHSDSTGTRRQVIMRRPSIEANTLGVGYDLRSLEEGGVLGKETARKQERKKELASNTRTLSVQGCLCRDLTHVAKKRRHIKQDSKTHTHTHTHNSTKTPVAAPTSHESDIQHCSGALTAPSSCSNILLPSVVPSSPELYLRGFLQLGLFRAS